MGIIILRKLTQKFFSIKQKQFQMIMKIMIQKTAKKKLFLSIKYLKELKTKIGKIIMRIREILL